MTIRIQHADPGDAACRTGFPRRPGAFNLLLRLCWPQQEVLDRRLGALRRDADRALTRTAASPDPDDAATADGPYRRGALDLKGTVMCRWLAYSGSPILLQDALYAPAHSLIDQSLHSRLGAETTNGDGFGVGWYGDGETPGRLPRVPSRRGTTRTCASSRRT